MTKSNTSVKYVSFVWDFAVDGGAIGPINTGVFIPAGAVVMQGFYKGLTSAVSAGAGTISVGWTGAVAALMTAQLATLIVTGTVDTTGMVPTFAAPVLITLTRQLVFSIAGAVVTAGKGVFTFSVVEMSI